MTRSPSPKSRQPLLEWTVIVATTGAAIFYDRKQSCRPENRPNSMNPSQGFKARIQGFLALNSKFCVFFSKSLYFLVSFMKRWQVRPFDVACCLTNSNSRYSSNFSDYSPVPNKSAGTVTFFFWKNPTRQIYLKRHVLI